MPKALETGEVSGNGVVVEVAIERRSSTILQLPPVADACVLEVRPSPVSIGQGVAFEYSCAARGELLGSFPEQVATAP